MNSIEYENVQSELNDIKFNVKIQNNDIKMIKSMIKTCRFEEINNIIQRESGMKAELNKIYERLDMMPG